MRGAVAPLELARAIVEPRRVGERCASERTGRAAGTLRSWLVRVERPPPARPCRCGRVGELNEADSDAGGRTVSGRGGGEACSRGPGAA